MPRILIEPLLFNDYSVAVYNEKNELLLDKKYFTHGYWSAYFTARELQENENTGYKDCKIFFVDIKTLEEIPVQL